MKIWHILMHKALGLGAGLINVLVAAAVLVPETSYLYLTSLSASQIFMAFSGFGLSHRLVGMSQDDARTQKVWPWFALTQIGGLAVFFWLAQQSETRTTYAVLVFTGALLLLLLLAEWLRTATARQSGFIIYNLMLLATAPVILWQQDITYVVAILPFLGCLILLWIGRDFYRLSGTPTHPKITDLLRAFRVASVNQYYNFIILLFPILGMQADVVIIVLVFRFAIFYNWPNFFWLRFGHKQLAQGITPERVRQNRKFIAVNLVAFTVTLIAVWIAATFDLFVYLPSGLIDLDFAYLLLFFAGLRVVVNLYFPYELFLVYRSTLKQDIWLIGVSLGSFVMLAICMSVTQNPYILITTIELVWLSWRRLSQKVLYSEH